LVHRPDSAWRRHWRKRQGIRRHDCAALPSGYEINFEETAMNWDIIEGNWKQFKGKAKEQWGKLSNSQLDVIAGERDKLVGTIQETYGITKDQSEKQLAEWQAAMKSIGHGK
jgi:uncharacterized protein YjbJ (UPF0337 family)